MGWRQRFRKKIEEARGNESGIALFMVMAAITVLVILVTEVSYVSSVNRKMANNAQDQLKAHYLAKSGLKLSLLRLKAYQHVKGLLKKTGGAVPVPKGMIEKIWSFPLMFPIPTELPGMSLQLKDEIQKFQTSTGLEGSFTAAIESESTKWNINSVLPEFALAASKLSPSPSPSPGTSPTPKPTPDANGVTPTSGGTKNTFDQAAARKALQDYLTQILQNRFEADPEFAEEYRDFQMEEFMDYLLTWIDRTYEPRYGGRETIPPKRAPMYSINELHMIYGIDDKLFELFAPLLTTSLTNGINVNTMNDRVLKVLLPQITDEEVKDFFEFRDAPDQDNLFKAPDDFFKYVQTNIGIFRNDQAEVQRFKKALEDRKIRIITDETTFKITVQAQVNQSIRLIEATVILTDKKNPVGNSPVGAANPDPNNPQNPVDPQNSAGVNSSTQRSNSGLQITSMRIL